MQHSEHVKLLEAVLAQAEMREEEMRLNYLVARNQTLVLKDELKKTLAGSDGQSQDQPDSAGRAVFRSS